MQTSLSRRTLIRAASFLSAAFVVLGGMVVSKHQEAKQYKRYLQAGYQHAFAELTSSVDEISTSLQKSAYATSPAMISSLCTQVFGQAMSAQMAMGELPYANLELEQTAAFLAKVGDYAYALSRSAAVNGGYSGTEADTVTALSRQAADLSAQLSALEAEVLSGDLTLEDVTTAEARLSQATETGDLLGGSAFQDIESEFPELPTLIYDGPFSEHLDNRTPLMLADRELVDAETAKAAAADFLGLKPEIFSLSATVEGVLPAYSFTAAVDGGEVTVEVTQQGGMVLSLTNSRTLGAAQLTAEEGVALARSFLEERGCAGMTESYYTTQGSLLTVNLAAAQDGVICYPDLIKVSIGLDTGTIVGYEAHGYLMNHTSRTLGTPAVTLEQAQALVSPRLKQLAHQLAVIPTDGQYEVLCWEFKCETEEGQHFIVYLNAQTGAEEKIFLLLEDENGTLAI
jgi:germination protein YpeB